jgi:hypothetical protein
MPELAMQLNGTTAFDNSRNTLETPVYVAHVVIANWAPSCPIRALSEYFGLKLCKSKQTVSESPV